MSISKERLFLLTFVSSCAYAEYLNAPHFLPYMQTRLFTKSWPSYSLCNVWPSLLLWFCFFHDLTVPCLEDHSSYVVGLTFRSLSTAYSIHRLCFDKFLSWGSVLFSEDPWHQENKTSSICMVLTVLRALWQAPASTLPLPFSSTLLPTPSLGTSLESHRR